MAIAKPKSCKIMKKKEGRRFWSRTFVRHGWRRCWRGGLSLNIETYSNHAEEFGLHPRGHGKPLRQGDQIFLFKSSQKLSYVELARRDWKTR
jgi:hypothetical protein